MRILPRVNMVEAIPMEGNRKNRGMGHAANGSAGPGSLGYRYAGKRGWKSLLRQNVRELKAHRPPFLMAADCSF